MNILVRQEGPTHLTQTVPQHYSHLQPTIPPACTLYRSWLMKIMVQREEPALPDSLRRPRFIMRARLPGCV